MLYFLAASLSLSALVLGALTSDLGLALVAALALFLLHAWAEKFPH